MNFSKHIRLIESLCSTHHCEEIAEKIAAGDHEGFNPYWKLVADERVLSDTHAMGHIATLVSDGFTSGLHPNWELKTVGDDTVETQMAGEDKSFSRDMDRLHDDMVDEDVVDVIHAHMVVPVAETHGMGEGWYEVTDAEATEFVVEDKDGNVVLSRKTRAEAEEAADSLNDGMTPADLHPDIPLGTHIEPELELVEDDEETVRMVGGEHGSWDDAMQFHQEPDALPNRFDKEPDYVVIINVVHERGERQREALEELHARGLWLSPEQLEQAGIPKDEG